MKFLAALRLPFMTPAAPPANELILYPKSDGNWYKKNSSNAEMQLANANHKFHYWVDQEYAYEDYSQGKFLRWFIDSAARAVTRFRPIYTPEYWNFTTSTWDSWTAGLDTIKLMCNGREENQANIDHTHRRFRWITDVSGGNYPLMALILLQTNWSAITYPGNMTVTIETSTSSGGTYTTRNVAVFGAATSGPNYGWHIKATDDMHTGDTFWRITVDITDWVDSGASTTIPIQRLEVVSGYRGAESLEPFSWDYAKKMFFGGETQQVGAANLPVITTPADPDSGYGKLYFKADNGVYKKVGSTETRIDSAASYLPARLWNVLDTYVTDQIVGYAGKLWKATATVAANKPPALFSSLWTPITGSDVIEWSSLDPYFEADTYSVPWELFWKTGTVTPSLTSTSGEFESGRQALKLVMSASSSQRMYEKDENILSGGEFVTVEVRAKLLAAAAGVTLNTALLQNDTTSSPTPLAGGLANTGSMEGAATLTTTWTTYTFTMQAVNAKPRAAVNLIATTGAAAGNVVIDRVKIVKGNKARRERWNSALQTVTNNTWSAIVTDTETQNVGGLTLSANKFTIPVSGVYTITGGAAWVNSSAGRRIIGIEIDGNIILSDEAPTPSASTALFQSISYTGYLEAGSVVCAAIYQSSGGNLNTSPGRHCRQSVTLIA